MCKLWQKADFAVDVHYNIILYILLFWGSSFYKRLKYFKEVLNFDIVEKMTVNLCSCTAHKKIDFLNHFCASIPSKADLDNFWHLKNVVALTKISSDSRSWHKTKWLNAAR